MIAKTNSDAIELLTGGAQHWGSRRDIRSSEGEVSSKGCLARAHRQMQENGRKHLIESRQLRKKEPRIFTQLRLEIVEEVQEREDQMGRSIAHYWAPTDCFRADNLNAVSASILEMMEPAGECCIESKISLSRAFEQATIALLQVPHRFIETQQSFKLVIEHLRALSVLFRYGATVGSELTLFRLNFAGEVCGSPVTRRTLAALKLNIQGIFTANGGTPSLYAKTNLPNAVAFSMKRKRLSARAIYPEVKPLQTWESELHGKFLYGLIIPWATGHCQSNTARPESEVFVGE
ncbi:hypothetical protein F5051DRAFT_432487 [Lentinula edodes]|nr:hypothetical protein F5051DRAFT_432487 [Lentinula edodes]